MNLAHILVETFLTILVPTHEYIYRRAKILRQNFDTSTFFSNQCVCAPMARTSRDRIRIDFDRSEGISDFSFMRFGICRITLSAFDSKVSGH